MVAMRRTFFLLALLLGACSTTREPTRLPPVIDGGSASAESHPSDEIPAPIVEAPSENRASQGAVIALLDRAEHYRRLGDTDAASATLERALRIDPRDAGLWYQLAVVRLQQGRAPQAEQLALKSNALSGRDKALLARNWALVARARWAQDDTAGAQSAERMAAEARR